MDFSGNFIDETLFLRTIQAEGDVSKASIKFRNNELKVPELLILKFNQQNTAVSSRENSEYCSKFHAKFG